VPDEELDGNQDDVDEERPQGNGLDGGELVAMGRGWKSRDGSWTGRLK